MKISSSPRDSFCSPTAAATCDATMAPTDRTADEARTLDYHAFCTLSQNTRPHSRIGCTIVCSSVLQVLLESTRFSWPYCTSGAYATLLYAMTPSMSMSMLSVATSYDDARNVRGSGDTAVRGANRCYRRASGLAVSRGRLLESGLRCVTSGKTYPKRPQAP